MVLNIFNYSKFLNWQEFLNKFYSIFHTSCIINLNLILDAELTADSIGLCYNLD